jgi:hypothetical protein
MKKLLVLLIPFIIGCGDSERVILTKDEYNKLIGIKTPEYPKKIHIDNRNNFRWRILIGADGHTYCENDSYDGYCMFHYPDCKKCIIRDSLMIVSILKNDK